METPTFRLLKYLGILGPKITQHIGWWNVIIDHHSSHGQGPFLVDSTDWPAQISPRCGANCALRRQAGQSLVAQGVHSSSHQVQSFKQFQFHKLFASRICFCFPMFPIGKYHLSKFTKDKTFLHFWRLSCEVLPNHPSWVTCRPGWDGLAVKLCDFGTARCR